MIALIVPMPDGERGRIWRRVALTVLAMAVLLCPVVATADAPIAAQGLDYNVVHNFGFEEFDYYSGDKQIAEGWSAFVLSGDPRFYKGTVLFTNPEHVEGKDSQVIRGDEVFEGGLYQVVTGLTAGVHYSVLGYVLSIFETSAHADPNAFDGLIYKQIGVDPYAGINPRSENVIWGPLVGENADSGTWGERFSFLAQQSTATVFIRIECLRGVSNSSYHNDIFIDAVQIRRAPVSQVTVPTESDDDYPPSGSFTVSWTAAVPSPSSTTTIIEYDVQYRDGTGDWLDWLSHTTAKSATFDRAEPGHNYTFRARAWARYYSPFAEMLGPWAESATVDIGQSLELTVYDNHGRTVANMPAYLRNSGGEAVVAGTTNARGVVYLAPGAEGSYDVVVTPFWFQPPEPVLDATVGAGIEPVGMTVRPPDDLVSDGSFEAGAVDLAPAGWTVSGSSVVVSDYARHGGRKSLWISSTSATSDVCIRQQFALADAYSPGLAFWYRLMPGAGGMVKTFTATVADGDGNALAQQVMQSQSDSGWLPAHLIISPIDTTYTGSVTVEFCVKDPETPPPGGTGTVSVYIDDVSLGQGAGGGERFYLPLLQALVE